MAGEIKIAISGKARSGKNTLAEILKSKLLHLHNVPVEIVALADPMKKIVMKMFPGTDPKYLWGASELREAVIGYELKDDLGRPLTYRQVLLDLGKLGRGYHHDLWLRSLVKSIEGDKNKTFIISDCRFPNEIKYLKDNGFYTIRLKRSDIPNINDISETAQSEIPDDYFHEIIDNSGTIQGLEKKAELTINNLKFFQ